MKEFEDLIGKKILCIHTDENELKKVVGKLLEVTDHFILLQIGADKTAINKTCIQKIKMKEDKQHEDNNYENP